MQLLLRIAGFVLGKSSRYEMLEHKNIRIMCLRQGAQTSVFLAVKSGLEEESGSYFAECANWQHSLRP